MNHSDFAVGTIFYTCTGQRWRCTDLGTRTILAIELKPDLDESWFNGPPYAVAEVPFGEYDIGGAYRNEEEAIRDAVESADNSNHPGFPHEVVKVMMKGRLAADTLAYPRKELLRIDRVDNTGKLLHPYAVERDNDGWLVLVYLPFTREFQKMTEGVFVRLHQASKEDRRFGLVMAGL